MIHSLFKSFFVLMLLFLLSACGEREGLAPVFESNEHAVNLHAKQHKVARGETLYSISFRYDKDYRQLAILNHLNSPYLLRVGQMLQLEAGRRPRSLHRRAQPVITKKQTPIQRPRFEQRSHSTVWVWPAHGRIVNAYAPNQGKKGIDIEGRRGEKILASSAGVVAYSGSGLTGYGNLIIIKHDARILTAYGHNSRNLVKEGQFVRSGQVIAEIGTINRRVFALHFEIRKDGKPVNPLNYLKKG